MIRRIQLSLGGQAGKVACADDQMLTNEGLPPARTKSLDVLPVELLEGRAAAVQTHFVAQSGNRFLQLEVELRRKVGGLCLANLPSGAGNSQAHL